MGIFNINLKSRLLSKSVIQLIGVGLVFGLSSGQAMARWYQVEVIVFKHTAGDDSEDWSSPRSIPNFANTVELSAPSAANQGEAGGGRIQAFEVLPRSSLQLGGVVRRLQQSLKYEPLMHIGWLQPGYSANSVRRVYLSDRPQEDLTDISRDDNLLDSDSLSAQTVEHFEGIIGLQGGRLLHVGTDFLYKAPNITTRLNEFRRIKLKELHYFDHPLFGVLLRVTPIRLPTTEASP